MLCCGYTFTDFPISIRLTSLALWQSNDCPSASKATLMNMAKYLWIHYERLHNHNKAKHNITVCIFLGIYCMGLVWMTYSYPRWLMLHIVCFIYRYFHWDMTDHVILTSVRFRLLYVDTCCDAIETKHPWVLEKQAAPRKHRHGVKMSFGILTNSVPSERYRAFIYPFEIYDFL